AWRRFWQELKQRQSGILRGLPDLEDRAYSVMAGGDFALIKAVEGFEDFTDFGRYQLQQGGVQKGDVVVAITEGGETSFVIGTAWGGLKAGAEVFFVYNNQSEVLCRHVQRSREVIEESKIVKLELTTGPMAITGSTRMQATTAELLMVGSALETALVGFLKGYLSATEFKRLGISEWSADQYHLCFVDLLKRLMSSSAVDSLARATRFEEEIYRRHGLITYTTDEFMLDVLTDTTERSPTFMLPPFRRDDDTVSPRSWAFIKNPYRSTRDAWFRMLGRAPRGLEWGSTVYERMKAPQKLQADPPRLGNSEIYKFQIGNEPDPNRTDAPDSALMAIAVGEQADELIRAGLQRFGGGFKKTAAIYLGAETSDKQTDEVFPVLCEPADSPLQLWRHLAIKLVLNTISTATMARMGRVIGNAMIWLSPSNKKLIDRGSRLISQLTGCGYDEACILLHQAMEEVEKRSRAAEEVPSPVALAIERRGLKAVSE
ncbi:MAG: hypothetical protein AMJ79_01870, partial [Phycisphaerae bacterium SM23_30]